MLLTLVFVNIFCTRIVSCALLDYTEKSYDEEVGRNYGFS